MVDNKHCSIISKLDDFYLLSANRNALDVIPFQSTCEKLNTNYKKKTKMGTLYLKPRWKCDLLFRTQLDTLW